MGIIRGWRWETSDEAPFSMLTIDGIIEFQGAVPAWYNETREGDG